MATVFSLVGLALVVGFHTVVAALLSRFLRVRLATRWGSVVYIATIVPVVLLVSTLLFTGVLGIGPDLGGAGTAMFVTIGVPLALGLTIDYVWMPHPDEVDLPETAG